MTAHEIQSATLRLALRHGYEAVTTEMIAAETGISLRTFFNYFPNKEEALVGRAPAINPEPIAWFQSATGALMDDLFELLRQHLSHQRLDRETTRMIGMLLDRSPELIRFFHASLRALAGQIAMLIAERTRASEEEVELTAEMVAHSIVNGYRRWASDETLERDEIVRHARGQITRVCAILSDESRVPQSGQ